MNRATPADRLRCGTVPIADPVGQQMTGAVADQGGEPLCDLAGASDARAGPAVRAGPADLVELGHIVSNQDSLRRMVRAGFRAGSEPVLRALMLTLADFQGFVAL